MVTRTLRFSLKRPDRDTVQFLRHVFSLKQSSSWESSYVSSLIRLLFLFSLPVCFADVLSECPNSCWASLKLFLFLPVKFFHQVYLSAILSNSSMHTEIHIILLMFIKLNKRNTSSPQHSSFYNILQKRLPQQPVLMSVRDWLSRKHPAEQPGGFFCLYTNPQHQIVLHLCLNYKKWCICSFILHLLLTRPLSPLSLVCWAPGGQLVSGSHLTCDLVKKSLWGISRLSCPILKQCCRSHPWI